MGPTEEYGGRRPTQGVSGGTPPVPWGCRGIVDRPDLDIHVLIGPEGDFSPEEATLALSGGWVPVTLGASRLRTETAALVAATMVYSEF